jgi:hypothetical protein
MIYFLLGVVLGTFIGVVATVRCLVERTNYKEDN